MNDLFEKLTAREERLAVVGLGYVGLPLAVAFARKLDTIGFDVNERKIAAYRDGHDVTEEAGDDAVRESTCRFTSDERELDGARFIVVAVPTPITNDKSPDLTPVISASETVGRHLQPGSVVVYESTVYPGVTQELCAAILERESGLKCGVDFKIGYSPERINPGDKVHRLHTIRKIVSGMDAQSLDVIANTYGLIIEAGVYRAENILVAEAAKVIENAQRDINIAFMNEIAMAFDKMGIDTQAVIRAMNTKWNALGFYPGLVGGHCIGVDPYYFVYRAEQLGYHSQIISAGRRVNDGMSAFVAGKIVASLIHADKKVKGARLAILGITFKENCADVRNTRVVDIIRELSEYEMDVRVVDPVADADEAQREYGVQLCGMEDVQDADAVVVAVAHEAFRRLDLAQIAGLQRGTPVLVDVKGIYDMDAAKDAGLVYWRL